METKVLSINELMEKTKRDGITFIMDYLSYCISKLLYIYLFNPEPNNLHIDHRSNLWPNLFFL